MEQQNWGRTDSFPGRAIGGEEGEALTVAKAWKDNSLDWQVKAG